MSWPAPQGEEAMVDRLVAEHEDGLHADTWRWAWVCPRCDEEAELKERQKLGWKRKCT
jgi:phage terminase large subunit GpA-like protein